MPPTVFMYICITHYVFVQFVACAQIPMLRSFTSNYAGTWGREGPAIVFLAHARSNVTLERSRGTAFFENLASPTIAHAQM